MRFAWIALFPLAVSLARDPVSDNYERLYSHVKDVSAEREANELYGYAWVASYHTLADVRMYQATHQQIHLDRALAKMSNVLANRDDRRGVKDFRGRTLAAWRDIGFQLQDRKAYRFGAPENESHGYCFVVHSGAIVYPMVVLAEQLLNHPVKGAFRGRTYSEWARELVARARETVAAHDEDWVDYAKDEGYYKFADFRPEFHYYPHRGRDIPFNQSHTLGAAMIVLSRITHEKSCSEKALRLATRFKRSLKLTPEGAYIWKYWQKPGDYDLTGKGEDASHAPLNVSFAREAFRSGLVFDRQDMQRFARTLSLQVLRAAEREAKDPCGVTWRVPDISDVVTGTQDVNRYWTASGRWFELTEFAPDIWARLYRVMDFARATELCGGKTDKSAEILLGHALALLYRPSSAVAREQQTPGR